MTVVSSKLVDTELLQNITMTPAGGMVNLRHGGTDGTFTNGAAWEWDGGVGAWGVTMDGDDNLVNFGNQVPAAPGNTRLWLHFVVRLDAAGGSQFNILSRQEPAALGQRFYFSIDTAFNRLFLTIQDAANNRSALSSTDTISIPGYYVFDGLININLALGMRLFINGSEPTYNTQTDPTVFSEIGYTGDYVLGNHPIETAMKSIDGIIIQHSLSTRIPEDWEIKQLAVSDMKKIGMI